MDSHPLPIVIILTVYMGILVVMIFLEFHLVDCMHAFHWLSTFADSLQNSDPSLYHYGAENLFPMAISNTVEWLIFPCNNFPYFLDFLVFPFLIFPNRGHMFFFISNFPALR